MTGRKYPVMLDTARHLFDKQIEFQKLILKKQNKETSLPTDDPVLFQYHMTAMIEELGEVLKADKRWKTHRNMDFDPENKLDELADCMLTLFNIAMYSDFSYDDLLKATEDKISENTERVFSKQKG